MIRENVYIVYGFLASCTSYNWNIILLFDGDLQ